MQKEATSIEILGSRQSELNQQRSQISMLINKEITALLFGNQTPGQLYKDKKPPDLLILLLDDTTIDALNQLTALPSSMRPALLVIAPHNDKQLMRLAMRAGARDFFSHPADKEELHKALNQIIFDLRRGRSQQGILTTVINAKGGSGSSFIACNLAHLAAVASDSSVVLMDFDLQFGAQSLNLDLKPQHTIVEALNDVAKLDFDAIDGYMTVHKSGLRMLSTVLEQLILPGEIAVENLDQLLTLAISHYNRIFVDLPRQIDPLSAAILDRSDQIVIVVQQSLVHLRDAKRLTRILKSEFNIAGKNIFIVINRYNSNGSIQIKDVENTLECENVFTIPNDYEKAAQSANLGIPLYDYARSAPITQAILSLTESLNVKIKDEFKEKSFFQRLFHSKNG
jgi:pilus assembly protein CpaE